MTRISRGVALFASLFLAACGGGGGGTPGGTGDQPKFGELAIPGISPTTNFSFDLGTVAFGKYYLTDRNNKAVDVVDTNTFAVSQITGTGANAFTGVGPSNAKSGPNGINAVPGPVQGTYLLYVGDVNNVRIIDPSTNTVVKSIQVGTAGFRADEGCFDADDNLYMIAIPDADVPYAAIIDTNTQKLKGMVVWVDTDNATPAGGNEQCQYDPASKSFLVNNDGTIANPRGEVDVIPAVDLVALNGGASVNVFSLPGVKRFPLGNCDPTGLALGPNNEMASECRQGGKGEALTLLIMNRSTGAIVATLPAGGGDQIAYNASTNRYYVAASRWHASGVNDQGGGCSAKNPCNPMLFEIDATTHQIVATAHTGNNAHSVAVDPLTGHVYVPHAGPTNPAGCADCADNGYTTGGITVF